jgi:hypothetical protein
MILWWFYRLLTLDDHFSAGSRGQFCPLASARRNKAAFGRFSGCPNLANNSAKITLHQCWGYQTHFHLW